MKKRKTGLGILIIAEVIVLVIVLGLGLLSGVFHKDKKTVIPASAQSELRQNTLSGSDEAASGEDDADAAGEDQTQSEDPVVRETFSDEIETKLSDMTIEEKVAQMFITTPESLTGVELATAAGDGTKEAINKYPVGGLIYASDNFTEEEQMKTMLEKTQEYSTDRVGVELILLGKETEDEDSVMADAISSGQVMTLPKLRETELVVTDDLSDEIASGGQPVSETAVVAVNDGSHLIYVSTGFAEAYDAVLKAANNGEISKNRIDNAVGKILTEKSAME